MNFICKRAILALIGVTLQAPIKDLIKEIHKYQLEAACTTTLILDLSQNPTPIARFSEVAILNHSDTRKRIVLLTFPNAIQETGLTKSHISQIIDLRESLAKEKLAKLRLEGFGIEIFPSTDLELEEIIRRTHISSSDENFDKILKMRKAAKDFAAIKIQRSFKSWIKKIRKSTEQAILPEIRRVLGIAAVDDLYGQRRTIFQLITMGFGKGYLRNIGLTKPHIDAILEVRERPTIKKLTELGLRGIEIEMLYCTDSELEEIFDKTPLFSMYQKSIVRKIQKATKE